MYWFSKDLSHSSQIYNVFFHYYYRRKSSGLLLNLQDSSAFFPHVLFKNCVSGTRTEPKICTVAFIGNIESS